MVIGPTSAASMELPKVVLLDWCVLVSPPGHTLTSVTPVFKSSRDDPQGPYRQLEVSSVSSKLLR